MKSFISVYILALFLGLVEGIVYLCYTSSKDHLLKKRSMQSTLYSIIYGQLLLTREIQTAKKQPLLNPPAVFKTHQFMLGAVE